MFSVVECENPDLPTILLVSKATALSAQGHREDSLQLLLGVARFKPPAEHKRRECDYLPQRFD
jgi:hypothetical protein